MLQTEAQGVAQVGEVEASAVHVAAVANVAPPASLAPRRPILETLLDAHLCGSSRWPLASRILAAVERAPRPLTRAEVHAEVPEPGADRVISMLLARGVLIERGPGRRIVRGAREQVL